MGQRLRLGASSLGLFSMEPDDNGSHSLMQMRMIFIVAKSQSHTDCLWITHWVAFLSRPGPTGRSTVAGVDQRAATRCLLWMTANDWNGSKAVVPTTAIRR